MPEPDETGKARGAGQSSGSENRLHGDIHSPTVMARDIDGGVYYQQITVLTRKREGLDDEERELLATLGAETLRAGQLAGEVSSLRHQLEEHRKNSATEHGLLRRRIAHLEEERTHALHRIEQLHSELKESREQRLRVEAERDELQEDQVMLHFARAESELQRNEVLRREITELSQQRDLHYEWAQEEERRVAGTRDELVRARQEAEARESELLQVQQELERTVAELADQRDLHRERAQNEERRAAEALSELARLRERSGRGTHTASVGRWRVLPWQAAFLGLLVGLVLMAVLLT
ncbi:hypothetical protein OUQ99_10600 [Streptomonospora nanhaiensis]|uniref:Uncharacterized protein n=1 Tax=Streptomonospora nanhaiensis TaxID=1323731 RepID=A0ABY6YT40_9ACTN|nr:hypothetical protein [Streptomonospora nanhaiensis]WAE75489.1 hypothetical protein OUQ99_10600 [Streptomonospora nanhaiensis]